MDRESLRVLLAQGLSLEQIGRRYRKHPSTVGYWVQKHGLEAAGRDKYAPRGGLDTDRFRQLVEAGASIRELADAFDRSPGAIRHWLEKLGLKTGGGLRRREAMAARETAGAEIELTCLRHGLTSHCLERRLLPLPSLPPRGGRAAPAEGQADPRGRGRGPLCHLRVRPV